MILSDQQQQTAWLAKQIAELAGQQSNFQDRAFLLALQTLTAELATRTDQLTGELDARMWNPQDW